MSITKEHKKKILIPILGASGVGKSFFIDALLGGGKVPVGRDLEGCTHNLTAYDLKIPNPEAEEYRHLEGYRVTLFDTPGLDNSALDASLNFELLKKISSGIREELRGGSKLGGVIYLHDITMARSDGGARHILMTLRRLLDERELTVVEADSESNRWGQNLGSMFQLARRQKKPTRTFTNYVLVTTKWNAEMEDLEDNYTQLILEHWPDLLKLGAKIRRVNNLAPGAFNKSFWSVLKVIICSDVVKQLKSPPKQDGAPESPTHGSPSTIESQTIATAERGGSAT